MIGTIKLNLAYTFNLFAVFAFQERGSQEQTKIKETKPMNLGAFSISLAVKDLTKSREFYESLGFKQVGGDASQNWLILRSGESTLGLFQGMFEGNILTFNPGWNSQAEKLDQFDDVREIQKKLKANGLKLTSEADESTKGPASLTLVDPDGNSILIDQHVE